MGLYSELQEDLVEAFDDDLSDAVATLTVTIITQGAYDPATGDTPSTPVDYTMRCIVIKDVVGEEPDEPDSTDNVQLLVLDSEKTVDFKTDMKVNVRDSDYEIAGIKVDPVSATHILKCRKL